MSLLDELAGAELVVVDQDQRLVYCWFGGAGVNVYDEDGREVHYFTVGTGSSQKPTPKMVRRAIDEVQRSEEE